MANYNRPKWDEPEMIDWEERYDDDDWNEEEDDVRDNDRPCSPLGVGVGIGLIGAYGCYPRRQRYPRYGCYPRQQCYPRYGCYPRQQCYPRYGCYPRQQCYPRHNCYPR